MSTALPPSALDVLCRTLLDTRLTSVQRLTNNAGSAVHRITTAAPSVRSLIVKLYRGPASWRAQREHEALKHLGSLPTTFSVPTVVGRGAVPGTDATALVTQDMGKRLLHHAVRQGQMSRTSALSSAGELLNAFHQLPLYDSAVAAPPLAQRLTSLAARLPEPMRLATADSFVAAISLVAERPAVLCHGDLHLRNIVTRQLHRSHGLAVIDFEEIGPAVPEWDLAQTAVTTDSCAEADLEQLLAAYAHPVDTDLLAHLITVQCVRGWYYACRGEGRDEALWRRRLSLSFSTSHASAPLEGLPWPIRRSP